MSRVNSAPHQSIAVKNTPKPRRVTHADVKDASKAAAETRSNAMERALGALERGSPGRPPRPAPKVKRAAKK
jgi:hypothetical protein